MASSDRPRTRLLALGAVAALGLAACGSDEDAGDLDTVADTEPVESEPAVTDPPVTDPPATDPPASSTTVVLGGGGGGGSDGEPPADDPTTTDAPPADAGGDGACLIGDWVITNAEMNAYYDTFVAAVDIPGFDIDVPSGQVALSLTADTYRYAADFLLLLDIVGSTESGSATGSVTGTWSVTDGIITTTLGESDLEVIVTVAGQTLDGSEIANGILDSLPINDVPFDCAGPTVDFKTSEGGPLHTVSLTPA